MMIFLTKHYCILFLIIASVFFVFTLADQQNDLLYFNQKNVTALSKCIEYHGSLEDEQNYKNTGIVKVLSDLIAKTYSGKKVTKKDVHREIVRLVYSFRQNPKFSQLHHDQIIWIHLEIAIETAVVTCSDESSDVSSFNLINFLDKCLRLLDYILVDWSSVSDMISSKKGRALLRKYAGDAKSLLVGALNYTNNYDYFRIVMRKLWMPRAKLFFDGLDFFHSYPNILYTEDKKSPHFNEFENLKIYLNRSIENFHDRNLPISQHSLDRVLNIHDANHPTYDGELDIFARYKKNGMGRAEYHFEDKFIKLYQILFFNQELEVVGVVTDKDDVYEGTLPCHIMPEELQAIAYDYDSYRDYLSSRRDIVVDTKRNYAMGGRIREENLVFLPDTLISKVYNVSSGCFIREDQLLDETICDNTKQKKPPSVKVSVNSYKNSDKKEIDNQIESCFSVGDQASVICSLICEVQPLKIKNKNTVKVVINNEEDLYRLLHPEKRDSSFTKILSDVLSVMIGASPILHEELR